MVFRADVHPQESQGSNLVSPPLAFCVPQAKLNCEPRGTGRGELGGYQLFMEKESVEVLSCWAFPAWLTWMTLTCLDLE